MKRAKNPILAVLAFVGACTILYAIWNIYQLQIARQRHHETFSQPVPSGLPNFLDATPGAPPPQP
jgi:hypothetical protein